MKFIDETKIKVKAGKGGDGIVSFRREARVSHGGPDGGDGGRGGNIYFKGDSGVNTLLNIKLKNKIIGNDGENGRHKNQYGAAGKDVFEKVPLGTLVFAGDRLLVDITENKEYLIAKGGNGGRGNQKFKSAKNTTPRLSENGDKGEEYNLRLELKVLADVGFVGKPNAGKSTLLSKMSNAKAKIAEYSFTTLDPQLGFVRAGENSFVVADLPGLIQGASQGKGLGIEFLKHIERCRLVAHIIDFGDTSKNPITDFEVINNELKTFKLGLEKRRQVVVANKSDLKGFEQNVEKFRKKFPKVKMFSISALKERNIERLKYKLYDELQLAKKITYTTRKSEVTIKLETNIVVEKLFEGMYDVSGSEVRRIYDKIPLSTHTNFIRFNKKLMNIGVWDELRKKGIKNGDTVRIFSLEFDWKED